MEMTIFGLTGPSGAGKSTILEEWENLGVVSIDADQVYHKLLRTSPELHSALLARFPQVFLDGQLSRKQLAAIVFSDPVALEDLNAITHPIVVKEVKRLLHLLQENGTERLAIEALYLVESGLSRLCDVTVAVLSTPESQIKRLVVRDSISPEQAAARLSSQKDDAFYRKHCSQVINNTGDLDALLKEGRSVLSNGKKGEIAMDTKKDSVLESLAPKKKHGSLNLSSQDNSAIEKYSKSYSAFLDAGKTERDCVTQSIALAEAKGFHAWSDGEELKPGDKIYFSRLNKSLILAVIGETSLKDGMRLAASHIDAPRLDLKPDPLYEDSGFAMLKTHYYGGIKKYQWLSLPLELRGVVYVGDTPVQVSIGADPGDPVLVIPDLLPHFAQEQMKKSVSDAFGAEDLNAMIGNTPDAEDSSESVKLAVLKLLNEKYGLTAPDLEIAELRVVPAANARDVGLDRSLLGAYGHDDRSCSYAALAALLELEKTPKHTAIALLSDKEEIGSVGVTGMQSDAFDYFVEALCLAETARTKIPVHLRQCYQNSFCLSGDVCACLDPNHADVVDKYNIAKIGYGVGICKYTGARGKGGASDASAETMQKLRKLLNSQNVLWQVTELGKTDMGGGGTVAAYLAQRNIEVVDCGVPVLGMHAPFEVVSKLDAYQAMLASRAVFTDPD
jgi:dephospho-CoA kinase